MSATKIAKEDRVALVKKLRHVRDRKVLAEKLGITYTYLSQIINGYANLTSEMSERMKRVLDETI
jgi:plasmid maintenance system antidote protein VapI